MCGHVVSSLMRHVVGNKFDGGVNSVYSSWLALYCLGGSPTSLPSLSIDLVGPGSSTLGHARPRSCLAEQQKNDDCNREDNCYVFSASTGADLEQPGATPHPPHLRLTRATALFRDYLDSRTVGGGVQDVEEYCEAKDNKHTCSNWAALEAPMITASWNSLENMRSEL